MIELYNFESEQDMFNFVVRHFKRQNSRALQGNEQWAGGCVYRTNTGESCAVGCMISNDQYDPLIEGASLTTLVHDSRVKMPEFYDLACSLQDAHDMSPNMDFLFDNMKGVAIKYKLDASLLN